MKFYLCSILSITCMWLGAQSLSPQVVSNAGGSTLGQGGGMSWTLGELAVSRWQSTDNKFAVTEGFHQPQLQVSPLNIQEEQWVQIVPNPVREKLSLLTLSSKPERYLANLVDAQGRVLLKDLRINGKAEIDMSTYPAGIYILSIRQSGNSSVQNHKVVKL